MAQDISANLFTFTGEGGTNQMTYYPHAPGPIIQGQPNGGPRLEYQGQEGQFVYPSAELGREHINVQEESTLGPQIQVVLEPTVDATAATLTLLLPPINMAGKEEQDFDTLAIKTTSYGILPREGAHLTYQAIHLRDVAKHIILPH